MRGATCLLVLLGAVAAADARQTAGRATVTGQVVLPETVPVPPPKFIPGFAGVPDESVLVDAKSRGIRNVVVWLRPDDQNPKSKFADELLADDAKRPASVHVIAFTAKQVFAPRVLAARPGDKLTVLNTAAGPTNFFWDSGFNGAFNPVIGPAQTFDFPGPLVAESAPIAYKSNVVPVRGVVRIFEHPYYAVTDADGKFELRNAPAGKYRLVYWHENVGFKDGVKGRFGAQVEIAAGKDGTMALPAVRWDVTK